MSRRYMDFVPATARKETSVTSRVVVKPAVKVAPVKKGTSVKPMVAAKETAVKKMAAKATPVQKKTEIRRTEEPKLGVIEDWGLKKLQEPGSRLKKPEEDVKALKAKKVGVKETKKEEPKKKSVEKKDKKQTFEVPKSPFINQDKVEKRPLSKNYYQKKIEVPKEEPKGPVTIITKPEKQAHVSLIVLIIFTIILGAAAGTVAFLLLPK